eukprot:scaffold64989_cov27-Tisochrysis_lutea.AAC.1
MTLLDRAGNAGSGHQVGPGVPFVVNDQLCDRFLPRRARLGGLVADETADTWRNCCRDGGG